MPLTDTTDDDAYDPYEYVPDRIDAVTASGLAAMYESLNAVNQARLRSEEPEVQGHLLWNLVDKGAIEIAGFGDGAADR